MLATHMAVKMSRLTMLGCHIFFAIWRSILETLLSASLCACDAQMGRQITGTTIVFSRCRRLRHHVRPVGLETRAQHALMESQLDSKKHPHCADVYCQTELPQSHN